MSVAQYIDHTILKAGTTLADIEKTCEEAARYGFAAVCVPPYYVKDAKQILEKSNTKIATVTGFPLGYSHYTSKSRETAQALEDGADEVDMVMNLSAFKSNDLAYLESEIREITDLLNGTGVLLKLIIESGMLSTAEILKCCSIYRHYPIDFFKTSTGFAEKGATVEAVETLRKTLPGQFRIKASGGIKTYAFAQQLIAAGAARLGCSASVSIMEEEKLRGRGY